MAEFPPNWDGFFASIEGRQSTFSAPMSDGKPAFGLERVEAGETQNFEILVELLRGGAPLPREVRSWLADIFDKNSKSEFQIKALSRRHRGKPAAEPGQHFEAVRHFRDLVDSGMSRQRALDAAGTKSGIKRSTMEKAIAEFEDAETEGRREVDGSNP